jgi:hypothetical protein
VRAFTRGSPAQAKRQTGQRQFHWGTPPPAAEPRTIACTVVTPRGLFSFSCG